MIIFFENIFFFLQQNFQIFSILVLLSFCIVYKLIVLVYFNKKFNFFSSSKNHRINIIVILCSSAFTNLALILNYLHNEPFLFIPDLVYSGFVRFEFVTFSMQIYCTILFFRDLSSSKLKNPFFKFILNVQAVFSLIFSLYYSFRLCVASWFGIFYFSSFELTMYTIYSVYLLIAGFFVSYIIIRNFKTEKIRLLKHHISILGWFFFLPYALLKFLEFLISPFVTPLLSTATSVLLTGMIYYMVKRLAGFRFLNMDLHVKSKKVEKFSFVDDFKDVLVKLGTISSPNELVNISKDFFQKAFGIPKDKLSLFFKSSWLEKQQIKIDENSSSDSRRFVVEKVFSSTSESRQIVDYAVENRIMILDEIEFNHFYAQIDVEKITLNSILSFLKELNIDLFLPIFCESKIVGFILIDRNSRPGRFFTDMDRDEMLIYVNYIGSIIYFLTHMNLDVVLTRERNVKMEIYKKEKLLELIKKSIQPFLSFKTQKIGVMTYKNKKVVYCNQAAKDILKVDINLNKNLEISQDIFGLGFETATTFLSKKEIVSLPDGENVCVATSLHLEKDNTVMTISSPTIGDLIKDKLACLKDQNKWSYLLALTNTEEGKVINQLIPSDTPTLLNCKIALFEAANTGKNILLEVSSNEDALSFAHGIHKINKRHAFEEICIERNMNEDLFLLKLFGINPLFRDNNEISLIESLHKVGTLFVQNIHLLSLKLQKKLLELIVSGKFSPLKSDATIEADVLLIVSTTQNLQELVNHGLFLKELFFELRKFSVWLPALTILPEEELLDLVENLRSQLVYTKIYKNLLLFSQTDKNKLLELGCVSISELKTKIQGIILKKTKKQSGFTASSIIDPAFNVTDFDLIEVARLGKNALKDPKKLAMLLNKFKYNQSKVALFLNVNRSTVSRKCAQFGLDGAGQNLQQKINNIEEIE